MSRSDYYHRLSGLEKTRYYKKIQEIKNLDPYALLTGFSTDWKNFPDVTTDAIYHYLVHEVSFYTYDEFLAIKSLGAVNYFVSEKIANCECRKIGENYVIRAEVGHSYGPSHIRAWAIISNIGVVLSSHCQCKAGLREGCSHIGALLYCVNICRSEHRLISVTDRPAYWAVPSKISSVEPAAFRKGINLSTPQKLLCRPDSKSNRKEKTGLRYPQPNNKEWQNYLQQVLDASVLCAAHLVHPAFCEHLPKSRKGSLTMLYNYEYEEKSLEELQDIAVNINISCSKTEIQEVERRTKEQSKSKLWFTMRAGRVTGSRLRQVCHSKVEKPPLSLIKSVCYPMRHKFVCAATKYGCEHEYEAIGDYIKYMKTEHLNFTFQSSGFFISEDRPEFGSTPDGPVCCDCHGPGALEVKCPFCLRDQTVDEVLSSEKSYLIPYLNEKTGVLSFKLKNDHAYFYQVQAHMYVTKRNYCDFVAWTGKCPFQQRLTFNADFWESVSTKALLFFQKVLIPELLGKYFSRNNIAVTRSARENCENSCSGLKKVVKKKKVCENACLSTNVPVRKALTSLNNL